MTPPNQNVAFPLKLNDYLNCGKREEIFIIYLSFLLKLNYNKFIKFIWVLLFNE